MAYTSETRSGTHALKLEISASVYRLLQRWEEQRAYRKTVNELSRLDSAQLADLGLSRGEIQRAAREAAYGTAQ